MSSGSRKISQTPWFVRVVKKLKKNEKAVLDEQVKKIVADPEIGILKKGNLSGIRVHKFKIKKQEQLLAYNESEEEILLIMLGTHENYYRDLQHYLN